MKIVGAGGVEGVEGIQGAEGLRRIRGLLFIVRWLGHHWNRLYSVMGLLSKMSDWME